jgi:hypothetical protein
MHNLARDPYCLKLMPPTAYLKGTKALCIGFFSKRGSAYRAHLPNRELNLSGNSNM